jgi:CBS-domain-containing membrane protein
LALASSLALMMWTGSVHPPGGAVVMVAMSDLKFQSLVGTAT